jgi:gluconate 2-dehydrogenase gamma chain
MEESSGRRRFLKSIGALSAAGVPIAVPGAETHAHQGSSKTDKYMFLSAAEVAFLDAAVARLIPADELGPGAKEAGVTYFIDQQLFGGWGTMAKMYRQGNRWETVPCRDPRMRPPPARRLRALPEL